MRVAALLRVSTDKQVKKHAGDEETLPVQREAVRRFCAARDWELVREYAEEGISAWSNSSLDRSVLQDVLQDARSGDFQCLMIFKYDRLSRVSLEYPMLLWSLARVGVTVWSVADDGAGRQLKIEGQVDKLLRFVEGWQAETESYNTSVRVSAAMRRMAQRGQWTGGRVPFGYRPKRSPTKGNGFPFEVDEDEASAISLMFDLYLDEELGCTRIARRLTELGLRLRNGKPWDQVRVRKILTNPLVAGRPAYGRQYRDPQTHRWLIRPEGSPEVVLAPEVIPELEIVPWERFEAARRRRLSWNAQPVYPEMERRRTRADTSDFLLSGLLRCAYCGYTLVANHAMPIKRFGGRVVRYIYPRYLDSGKALGVPCNGQRSYSRQRLDAVVLQAVREALERFDEQEAYRRLRLRVEQAGCAETKRVELLCARVNSASRLYARWQERLDHLMVHPETSLYSEGFLAEQVQSAKKAFAAAQHELEEATRRGGHVEARLDCLQRFLATAPRFWEQFLRADPGHQKTLLRRLLDAVVVARDTVELHWRLDPASSAAAAEPGVTIGWLERRRWNVEGQA